MSGERVLVTGGAGYLGSVVVHELLAAGRAVRVLDALIHASVPSLLLAWTDANFEFVQGDVRDLEARRTALRDVGAVVHLAAIVGDPACAREPELAQEVNFEATRLLVAEAAVAGAGLFVFASTCSNYGKMNEGDAYATEEWELRPVSLYAETKVAAELEVLRANSDALATCCLRLATAYGVSPRMRFDLTVNEFVRDVLLADELLVYGEQFWRPYIHVRDAAEVINGVLDAPRERVSGQVFNVGNTAENYRKSDLVELLRERIPHARVRLVQKDDDPRNYRVSFRKLEEAMGLLPRRTIPQGIDELISFVRSGLIADPFAPAYRN
jgi:nucleoside-diphosphate-sugar epimerase